MSEYERMGLVRTLPKHMWTKAVDKLCLDLLLQPSISRYAALHRRIVARGAAEKNLELFELLDPDTTPPVLPAPHNTAATATIASPLAATAAAASATTTTATITVPPQTQAASQIKGRVSYMVAEPMLLPFAVTVSCLHPATPRAASQSSP